MTILKIARRSYRNASQTSLSAFAGHVVSCMDGVAAYESLQAQVQPLSALLDTYENRLVAAGNHGRSEMLAKRLAKEALILQLDKIASALTYLAQDNPQLVIDAGFTLQQNTGFRANLLSLPIPVITRAISTGNKGELLVTVDDLVPRGVVTHAFEYSLEPETGWQNGTFHTRRRFKVGNLPRAQSLWIRLKSIGHGSTKSDWCEPMPVAVL